MSSIAHATVTDTSTGTSAYTARCDLADAVTPWFPDAPADVTDAIAQLQAEADRGDTAAADATADYLGLVVDWAPGPADDPRARWAVAAAATPGPDGLVVAVRVMRAVGDDLDPEWAVGATTLPAGTDPGDRDAVADALADAAGDALAPQGLVLHHVDWLDTTDSDGESVFWGALIDVQSR